MLLNSSHTISTSWTVKDVIFRLDTQEKFTDKFGSKKWEGQIKATMSSKKRVESRVNSDKFFQTFTKAEIVICEMVSHLVDKIP